MLATANIARPAYDDLIELLACNQSATCNWDVIASFDLSALNKVLAAQHASGKILPMMDFESPFQDVDGTSHLVRYQISFAAPVLQFNESGGAFATLSLPISGGTFTVINPANGAITRSYPVPAGYTLSANVPLCAVSAAGPNPSSGPIPFGNVISIGDTQDVCVTLHFQMMSANDSTGAHFTINPALPADWHSVGEFLLEEMYSYFVNRVNLIDYALVRVSNSVGNVDGIKVTPKSFIFSISADVLSLYIQTTNSGNPPGDINPVFRPGNQQSLPVPAGKTASIIFSKQFIESVYIVPTLQRFGAVEFELITPQNPICPTDYFGYGGAKQQAGIAAAMTYNTPLIEINMSDDGFGKQFNINDLIIDFSKWPFHVALSRNQGLVTWEFIEGFNWSSSDWMPDPGGGADKVTKTGTKMIVANLKKLIDLTNINQQDLTVAFNVTGADYQIFGFGDDEGWSPSQAKLEAIRGYVGQHIPSFDLNFGGLNFFAIKTIIFSNQDRFTVDTANGFSVPGDLILVGDIA